MRSQTYPFPSQCTHDTYTTHTHDTHIYRISSTTYILYTHTILIKKTNKPTNRTEPKTENRTERADIIGSFEFFCKQDRIRTNTLNQTIFYTRKNTKKHRARSFVPALFPSFFPQRERKGRGRVGVCARTSGRDSSFVVTDVGRSVGSGRVGLVFSTSTIVCGMNEWNRTEPNEWERRVRVGDGGRATERETSGDGSTSLLSLLSSSSGVVVRKRKRRRKSNPGVARVELIHFHFGAKPKRTRRGRRRERTNAVGVSGAGFRLRRRGSAASAGLLSLARARGSRNGNGKGR